MNPDENPSIVGQAPDNHLSLRNDLLSQAKKLFANAEVVRLDDGRIPVIFQQSVKQLKITCLNEIVGVSCGDNSNLCVIVASYDDTTLLAKILELNPELHKTVWTTWHRIIFIWLRITGWRPRNCALAGCLWIAAGIIPAVEVADATHYCNGFPVTDRGSTFMTIKFSDLKWPKILHEPFLLERLEGQYGQLFQTGPRRRESFSFQTAAQFFAATLRLKYSRRAESFTICSEAGEPTPVQTSTLTDFISEWLHAKVETAAVRFPAGDPVTSIITALKDICVIEKTDELNGLLNFLRERLERKAGSSLTTKEMFDHYLAYCKASGAAIYPERAFYKRLAVEMKYLYQACKAHDIKRSNQNGGSTDKYGFHHVAIKSIALEAADASESTEPPEACQVGSKFA
jgi:hypothetical protein